MDTHPTTDSRGAALEECDKLFKHFDEQARRYKRTFARYKYSSIALTVGVTVVSALQAIYAPSFVWQWILPVASGLAAFFTTMVHATNAQELWLRARSMTQKLATERFLFLQTADPYTGDDTSDARLFAKRLMEVWSDGHAEWQQAIEGQK